MSIAERTKNFWSDGFGSRVYRRRAGKHYAKMHEETARHIVERGAHDVLDIACGPGDFLFYLSSVAPDIHLSGSDLAPGMVAHARKKLGDRATVVEAAGGVQPFADGSFDAITIMMAFHHFPEKARTLGHIKKLLRPGGMLIIADVVARSDFQKRAWNILERLLVGIRGYIDHYTERDMRDYARAAECDLAVEPIPAMPRRYRIMTLTPR